MDADGRKMDFTPQGSRPGGGVMGAVESESLPTHMEVEAALKRVLGSQSFATSPRLQELLGFVVAATLDGDAERLKEYSVAVDVFKRPPGFDPRMDSIVRVQASRLRKQLADYYRKAGGAETIRIDVPAGGYAATFTRMSQSPVKLAAGRDLTPANGEAGPESEPETVPESGRGGRPPGPPQAGPDRKRHVFVLLTVATLVLAALVTAAVMMRGQDGRTLLADPSGPTVFIARYNLIDGEDEVGRQLRDGLQYELIDRLSRFPELSVLGIDTVYGAGVDAARLNPRGADFILSGSVQSTDGGLQVTNQLVRTSDNTVVWSRAFSSELSDAYDLLDVQSDIAGDVAGQLGQPYGVIQEKLNLDADHPRSLALQDYLCVVDANGYARSKSVERHFRVRDCLEQAVARSPHYAPAWAKLSWMYGDEARFGFNRRAEAPPPFERARAAAMQAVEADPTTAIGHQYLSIALFNLGEDQGFRAAGEKALLLNPNNSEILADFGQQLILVDGSERGKELVERAIELNPGHPPWYFGGLAIYHLVHGDREEALHFAQNFSADGSPMAMYTLAAAWRLNGDDARADQVLADLEARSPGAVSNREERMKALRMARKVEQLIFGD
jgi:adenylate cyclase